MNERKPKWDCPVCNSKALYDEQSGGYNFQFALKSDQATDIASKRDIQVGTRMDYLYHIQLRFCPLETGKKDIADEFPPSLQVHVNGKMVQLPNPIPTNKPGVGPKRPPKPVNSRLANKYVLEISFRFSKIIVKPT